MALEARRVPHGGRCGGDTLLETTEEDQRASAVLLQVSPLLRSDYHEVDALIRERERSGLIAALPRAPAG